MLWRNDFCIFVGRQSQPDCTFRDRSSSARAFIQKHEISTLSMSSHSPDRSDFVIGLGQAKRHDATGWEHLPATCLDWKHTGT